VVESAKNSPSRVEGPVLGLVREIRAALGTGTAKGSAAPLTAELGRLSDGPKRCFGFLLGIIRHSA
jgi:hypothetical protein